MYEIITNAPPTDDNRGRPPKYPVADLKLHDAFDVPANGVKLSQLRAQLVSATNYHRRKRNPGARFSIRLQGDGFRVRREA